MFFTQLKLLLWKNLIIRIRHPLRTIIEVIWPILLFSILIAVRLTVPPVNAGECHYPARALPSAGVFPWIQTMFCNIDNPCFNVSVASEKPGQINYPTQKPLGVTGGLQGILSTINEETTIFSDPVALNQDVTVLLTLYNEIAKPDSTIKTSIASLMGDSALVRASLINITSSSDLASTILESQVSYYQVSQLSGNADLGTLVCDESALSTAITIQTSSPLNASQTSRELCALNDMQLLAMAEVLRSGVDLEQFLNNEV